MNVLGIVSSARQHSNSATLVNEVLNGAADKGSQTEVLNINTLNLHGCQDCYKCKTENHCMTDDDMQKVYELIDKADAIVMGSPIHMGQMNAQMKMFVDRLFAYMTPQGQFPALAGKKLVMIYTQGQPNPDKFKTYIDLTTETMKMMQFNVSDVIVAGGVSPGVSVTDQKELISRAFATGQSLIYC